MTYARSPNAEEVEERGQRQVQGQPGLQSEAEVGWGSGRSVCEILGRSGMTTSELASFLALVFHQQIYQNRSLWQIISSSRYPVMRAGKSSQVSEGCPKNNACFKACICRKQEAKQAEILPLMQLLFCCPCFCFVKLHLFIKFLYFMTF